MSFYLLILAILGVWRITHLLNQEAGPADILTHFRRGLGSSLVGQLLDCFYCLSLWTALPIAALIGHSWFERLLLWPALSGAAILLEKMSARREPPLAGYYEEEPEEHHVLR